VKINKTFYSVVVFCGGGGGVGLLITIHLTCSSNCVEIRLYELVDCVWFLSSGVARGKDVLVIGRVCARFMVTRVCFGNRQVPGCVRARICCLVRAICYFAVDARYLHMCPSCLVSCVDHNGCHVSVLGIYARGRGRLV